MITNNTNVGDKFVKILEKIEREANIRMSYDELEQARDTALLKLETLQRQSEEKLRKVKLRAAQKRRDMQDEIDKMLKTSEMEKQASLKRLLAVRQNAFEKVNRQGS